MNGKWELLPIEHDYCDVYRIEVPGGWLYRVTEYMDRDGHLVKLGSSIAFVPDAQASRRANR